MVTYPQGWETYRVIDVADLFDNLRIPVTKNQRRPGNTPYYGANGIQDYVDGYTHDGEFVLIAEDGANDLLNYPVTYAKGKIWVNNHAHVISAKESVAVTKFLYYLLKKVDYTTFLVGGTRAKLNGKTFKNIEITIPSNTSEQKAISSILSDLDNHIDNLGKLIEKKKNIRDGALEDLICCRTRLDGFHDDWIKVSFNQVIVPKARIGWQGLKKHEYLRNGYSYLISGTDFKDGTISLDNISFVSKERYDMDENIQVKENDVLVTKDGTIGKVAMVPTLSRPATLNSGVFVFRTAPQLEPAFLYRVLMSSVFREFIDTLSAGSTIKHLYQKDLKNFKFEMPKDVNEQRAISDVLTAMDKEIKNLEAERDKMIQIREGAMDDLLTGRVRLTV
ncbi:MAG TPA: restriction endonuclease subunit S [Acetivibrio sp.]|uniref:restriction endonuclease subunit S n=1 Tax=Acetivibrio sp. TaxID=1872092 RepID=UPI002BCD4959|nr:restriction endonuclease subunit S [Acetivibrio sp.]HOM03492.1 restriction endonuclease subunit S [Acetivibrio sp.]